jgi:hypothetical protein
MVHILKHISLLIFGFLKKNGIKFCNPRPKMSTYILCFFAMSSIVNESGAYTVGPKLNEK